MTNNFMRIYSVTLFDCKASSADKEKAEDAYMNTLDKIFGSAEMTLKAYKEHQEVFNRYEEWPLPESATDEEKRIVDRWMDAESDAWEEAFKDWLFQPSNGEHFEINY